MEACPRCAAQWRPDPVFGDTLLSSGDGQLSYGERACSVWLPYRPADVPRHLPRDLDVAPEAEAIEEIERTVTNDLVGDVGVTHSDVSGLGCVHICLTFSRLSQEVGVIMHRPSARSHSEWYSGYPWCPSQGITQHHEAFAISSVQKIAHLRSARTVRLVKR